MLNVCLYQPIKWFVVTMAVYVLGFTWNLAGNPDVATHLPQSWRHETQELRQVRGIIHSPSGEWIAVGFQGELGKIWVLDHQGRARVTWLGKQGKHLLRPNDLAVSGDRVWVSDAGTHKVWLFDQTRRRKTSLGGFGDEPGRLNHPAGLWWDGQRLWVAELGNQRIQRFDDNGRLLDALTRFDRDRPLLAPTAVTGDGNGRFFVADAVHQQIAVLDRDGQPQSVIGDYGFFPGLIDHPSDLLWDRGRILVLEQRNHRIQAFSSEGESLWLWGVHEVLPHEGRGRLHYPNHFAFDHETETLVIAESLENRLQFFDFRPSDQPEPYDPRSAQSGRFHFGPYLDTHGSLLVTADNETHQVQIYDIRGEIPINLHQFGERGQKFGLMRETRGLALDPKNQRIVTTDRANQRIQLFAYQYDPKEELKQHPDMSHFHRAFSYRALNRRSNHQNASFDAVFVGPDGSYRLIDSQAHQIRVFDPQWVYRQTIGAYGRGRGAFNRPTDLAFSADGKQTLVVDQNNRRIVVLDEQGRFRRTLGRRRLQQPFGVAVSRNGTIYVSDQMRHEIVVFDPKGRFVKTFGGQGTEMGQFWRPADIDMTDDGRLCVIDQGNHRLQLFKEDGSWLVTLEIGSVWTHRYPPRKQNTPKQENR